MTAKCSDTGRKHGNVEYSEVQKPVIVELYLVVFTGRDARCERRAPASLGDGDDWARGPGGAIPKGLLKQPKDNRKLGAGLRRGSVLLFKLHQFVTIASVISMQTLVLPVPMVALALLCSQAVTFADVAPDPKDPQYQKTGEQRRTYKFPGTDEVIGYHLYVPSKWNKNTKLPLVLVLHGGSLTAEAPFERADGILAKTAEQHGYILAGVLGYRP